ERDEAVSWRILGKILVYGYYRLIKRRLSGNLSVNGGMKTRHEKSGSRALARHVAKCDQHRAIAPRNKIVVIAADLEARKRNSLELVTFHYRRARRLETLLDLSR